MRNVILIWLTMISFSSFAQNKEDHKYTHEDSVGAKFYHDWYGNRKYGRISKSDFDSISNHFEHIGLTCNSTLMGCVFQPINYDKYIVLVDKDCNKHSCNCSCGWHFTYSMECICDTLFKVPSNEHKIKWTMRLSMQRNLFDGVSDTTEDGTPTGFWMLTPERFEKRFAWSKYKMEWIEREDYIPTPIKKDENE